MPFTDRSPHPSSILRAAALSLVALGALTALPAAADPETRFCQGVLRFTPQNPSQTYLTYTFKTGKTVRYRTQANDARHDARARMISCVRDHWNRGNTPGLPDSCLGVRGYHFHNYPFTNMQAEAGKALCDANPGMRGLTIRVDLQISGRTGCGGGNVSIAHNAQIQCIRQPEIGDRGMFDCVGEGCPDGAPPAEPPAEPPVEETLPPAATYQPLPMFCLPGNDLYMIELSAPNWMLCRQACTEDTRCGAWTYRAPNRGAGPLCLIKSRGGVPIPNAICRSGIKQ